MLLSYLILHCWSIGCCLGSLCLQLWQALWQNLHEVVLKNPDLVLPSLLRTEQWNASKIIGEWIQWSIVRLLIKPNFVKNYWKYLAIFNNEVDIGIKLHNILAEIFVNRLHSFKATYYSSSSAVFGFFFNLMAPKLEFEAREGCYVWLVLYFWL